jgi:type IV fimbrial biogenesis protein FimT
MKSCAGFTLIELMVAITILAILLFIALPNFAVWMQNTQIRTAGEAVLNGMQLARAEAIRRNVNVELGMDASSGWTARVAGTGEVIQSRLAGEGSAAAAVTISPAGATKITFNGFGSIATNADGTATLTEIKIDSPAIAAADSRELCVLVRTGGNVRMCDPNPLVLATDPRSCGAAVPAGCL